MMTVRQRILATLRGEPVDRIAWAPRWELWFNAARNAGRLPSGWEGLSLFEATRQLGWGIKGREARVHREVLEGVEVRRASKGDWSQVQYVTPVGTISEQRRLTPELAAADVAGRLVKPLVAEPADYGPALYVVEHTRVVPAYDEYLAYDASIGEDGVALAQAGSSPAHRLMREFTDYEGFYYQLADHPDQVQELLAALIELDEDIQEVAAASPALIVEYDGNYDDQLTPAPIYRRYFLPRFQQFADRLHAAGKYFATHTDGHHAQLLELIRDSGFDIAEAFTTPPMTAVGIRQARAVWGDQITIWGGIASNMLSAWTPETEFEAHLRQVLREAAPGDRFILGTGDNIPTDAEFPRLQRLSQLVEQWTGYPLAL
ncbi:MAG: uroporphyrinogen decarboxylase family protein [Anaerolineae bacterium]